MTIKEIILGGLVVAGAAVAGYVLVEWGLQRFFALGGRPPAPGEDGVGISGTGAGYVLPSDKENYRKQAEAIVKANSEEESPGRAFWHIFPGFHPGCYFELREQDSFEENWERFQEWLHDTWGHAGEPPDEWWEEAAHKLEMMLEKSREFRREMEVAKFNKELEDL